MKMLPLCLVLMVGCSFASRVEKQAVTPQTYEENWSNPVIVCPPTPAATSVAAITTATAPATTVIVSNPAQPQAPVIAYATGSRSFKGQGIQYFNDTHAARIMSPFGVSPGEVVTEAAKKPATISAGDTPTISMGADGSFRVGKGDDSGVVGTTTAGGILTRLGTFVKDWGLIVLVVIGAVIVLPFLFPVLGPIFSHIWSTLTVLWTKVKSIFSTVLSKAVAEVKTLEAKIAPTTVTPPVTPVTPPASTPPTAAK